MGVGKVISRETCIVCGMPLLEMIIEAANFKLRVDLLKKEGALVGNGDILAEIKGSVKEILSLERTALNFIQRLCGIATRAQQIISKSQGIIVADTRKTTPGWRILEKYAVKTAGGRNHRFNLGDMILVKENHIDANGGSVSKTLQKISTQKPIHMSFEVEVRNYKEMSEALKFSPNAIMLDNMSDSDIRECIKEIKNKLPGCLIEVSGGINTDRFEALKGLGVELVSMGTLTTNIKATDISMDIVLDVSK